MIKIINVYKDSRVMEMTTSSNLGLGVRTDNDVDLLRFTFDEMIVGTAQLLTSLTDEYGELVAFPLTLNQEENSYDIEVTKYLASQGNFTIQLEITTNGMIWHSKQAEVILDDCLAVGEGDMPSVVDNWLQHANMVLAEMEEATTGAEKVNVEVEEVDDTYEVTFTDRNGNETQATIYQGKNANVVGSYDSSDTNAYSTNYINNQISTPLSQEITNRQNADNELQSQIDAITVSSDVVDIVGTYQELQDYDTQHIKANDIIKVLQDSTHNDALSYYRWVITDGVGEWVYVGSEGPFYTKSETDSLVNSKVDTTTFNTSQQAQDTLIANKVNTSTYNQGQATQDTKITNLENQVFGDETIEGEGTSLTLNNTLKGQFNFISPKGNTSQTGTPTPTSPIPVNVVSGDNEINVCGKNLFSGEPYQANAVIQANGTINSNNNYDVFKTIVGPNQTYTISITSTETTDNRDMRVISYTTDGTYIEATVSYKQIKPNITTTQTFTTPANAGYILYHVLHNSKDVMLEKGSTSSTYEPYQGNTYNIDLPVENLFDKSTATLNNGVSSSTGNLYNNSDSFATDYIPIQNGKSYTMNSYSSSNVCFGALYDSSKAFLEGFTTSQNTKTVTINNANAKYIRITGQKVNIDTWQLEKGSKANTYTPYGTTPIELCKIGNYQDYFYKDSDKWYLHKEIGKVVLNGSETWTYASITQGSLFRSNNAIINSNSNQTYIPFSNYYEGIAYSGSGSARANNKFYINPNNNYVDFIDNRYTSVDDFKTFVTNNNVYVYYSLATPTNTEITYQPLIDQLNLLEKAQSKENQTNISQVNNDLPFIISASAFLNNLNGKIALLNKLTEV